MDESLRPAGRTIPVRLKRLIMFAGLGLAVFGLPAALNLFCIAPFLVFSGESETPVYVLASMVLVTVTFMAGWAFFHHANRSLNGKPSRALRLPSMLLLMDLFGVVLIFGLFVTHGEILQGVLLPPLVFLAAALPPLWTVSWFVGRGENALPGLTWRRGVASFAGGASAGSLLTLGLGILVPAVILALGSDLFVTAMNGLDQFFRVLGRVQWTSAWGAILSSPGFVFVFLQFALILPLVEELAKPLVLLPVLRHLDRQETFLLGAIAGAGFCMLENAVYASMGISIWVEFMFVMAIGSAIQPLGTGLVAQGWLDVLRDRPGAWGSWWRRFGAAAVTHIAWKGAVLLVVLFGEMLLAGRSLQRIGGAGIAMFGLLFLFLCMLGASALWLGGKVGRGKITLPFGLAAGVPGQAHETANRSVALWAVACLALILPAGVILLRIWLP